MLTLRSNGFRLLVLVATLLTSGCIVFVSPRFPLLSDRVVERQVQPAKRWLTTDKVLLVDLSGELRSSPSGWLNSRENTVGALSEALERAADDDRVVAVILRVDSPGGDVTASDLCYRLIRRFREETARRRGQSVPVVAELMGVAASGGYYAAVAADEIWALETTVTGSIGVMATLPQASGLAEKIGVNMRVIKSGANKDLGSPWRDMTPEERQILQGVIDSLYERFVRVVAENRSTLDEAQVRQLADGRVYTAQQAREAGLIDHIGYLDEAVEAAIKRAKVSDAAVVTYAGANESRTSLYSKFASPTPPDSLAAAGYELGAGIAAGALGAVTPRFYYLWTP
jgi:protease-4